MSIAAVTEAIDNFATNDDAMLLSLIAIFDRMLAEVEAKRAKKEAQLEEDRRQLHAEIDEERARIADQKVAIVKEFEARRADLDAILNGKPSNA